jgi:DNA-binding NtrC family response regulator
MPPDTSGFRNRLFLVSILHNIVQTVAATNTDLRLLVKEGKFREDLFYRLNVIPITLPPLRNRREDIPLLAQHFLKKSCRENGVAIKPISQDALRLLMSCDWPGNIWQFANTLEHAVAMSSRPRRSVRRRGPRKCICARRPVRWCRRVNS